MNCIRDLSIQGGLPATSDGCVGCVSPFGRIDVFIAPDLYVNLVTKRDKLKFFDLDWVPS